LLIYERWLAFEDYPKFITAIKRVREIGREPFFRVRWHLTESNMRRRLK